MAKRALLTLVVTALVAPVAAMAQMDTLTPHLENQRNANIRKHQQKMHEQRTKTNPQGRTTPTQRQTAPQARITPGQRQAAWSRHKAEYRRRLLTGGQTSADRWLDQQILAGR